ncbi:NERD domain-containing protein [Streptomyces sp. Wb2n-11]|uniref:NERD domain-containing protein n=1 Tax=Streptomyces sp. Wb2n-11 TaxID=1030533 RepID=UPI000AA92F4D|nr:NERD domain-containing protein [Streptomyces sp. Wb2n-11]
MSAAGRSADAWAKSLRAGARRGLWRRLLAWLGVGSYVRRAEAQAAQAEAGAEGERRTAALLAPLAEEGWYGLYDRALPRGGKANADFVLVPPCGRLVVNVDAKLWSGRWEVHCEGGPLFHGTHDRSRSVSSLLYETREIVAALGVPVVPVMAVHNAPVADGRFVTAGITVLPADQLVVFLRSLVGRPDPGRAASLAGAAGRVLLPYVERG